MTILVSQISINGKEISDRTLESLEAEAGEWVIEPLIGSQCFEPPLPPGKIIKGEMVSHASGMEYVNLKVKSLATKEKKL